MPRWRRRGARSQGRSWDYQTNVPGILAVDPGNSNSYANWSNVVDAGVAAFAGNIELWDWPTGSSYPGSPSLPPS